jgi:hypothetical protein
MRQSDFERMHETYGRDTYGPDAPELLRLTHEYGGTSEAFVRATKEIKRKHAREHAKKISESWEECVNHPQSYRSYAKLFDEAKLAKPYVEVSVSRTGLLSSELEGSLNNQFTIFYRNILSLPSTDAIVMAQHSARQEKSDANGIILLRKKVLWMRSLQASIYNGDRVARYEFWEKGR